MSEPSEAYLQIGEVAERTSVTQRTLRFYEEKGLLNPPSRMEGGFRLYSEDDVRRVEQIRRLQGLLGFSLAEIKEMVDIEEVKDQLREEWRLTPNDRARQRGVMRRGIEVHERQHTVITQKVGQLLEMKRTIEEKLAKYHSTMDELENGEPVVQGGRQG